MQDQGYGTSAIHEQGYGTSSIHEQGYGTSVMQEQGYGTSVMQEQGYGRSVIQEKSYGSSSMQEQGYGASLMQEKGYGTPSRQEQGYGRSVSQEQVYTAPASSEEMPWLCGMCDYENTPARLICYECSGHRERVEVRNRRAESRLGITVNYKASSPAPTAISGFTSQVPAPSPQVLSRRRTPDPYSRTPDPYSRPSPAQQQPNRVVIKYPNGKTEDQTFDWNCGACGNRNFASRKACNRCLTVREECEVLPPPSAPSNAGPSYLRTRPRNAADMALLPPRTRIVADFDRQEDRTKDWHCTGCGNRNWAKRDKCNKCKEERSKVEDPSVTFENPNMLQLRPDARRPLMASDPKNPRSRYEPYTAQPRPAKRKWVDEDKSKDWMCGTCKINNFVKRKACFRCCKPRSECEEKKEGEVNEVLLNMDSADRSAQSD